MSTQKTNKKEELLKKINSDILKDNDEFINILLSLISLKESTEANKQKALNTNLNIHFENLKRADDFTNVISGFANSPVLRNLLLEVFKANSVSQSFETIKSKIISNANTYNAIKQTKKQNDVTSKDLDFTNNLITLLEELKDLNINLNKEGFGGYKDLKRYRKSTTSINPKKKKTSKVNSTPSNKNSSKNQKQTPVKKQVQVKNNPVKKTA